MELKVKTKEQINFREGCKKSDGSHWEVTTFLFEEDTDHYPQSFTADVWNTSMAQYLREHIGESVTAHFDMNAHEYNGRWYDNHKVFKLTKNGRDVLSLEPVVDDDDAPTPPVPPEPEGDELPF